MKTDNRSTQEPAAGTAALEIQRLRQYLKAIASLGDDIPDNRLTDAPDRGLMYSTARQLARLALADPIGIQRQELVDVLSKPAAPGVAQ